MTPKASIPLPICLSRRWQARPRILLLPHSQHIDIVKLASIVIRNYNDFSKSPILGAKKSMLELRQGLETLQSSEMMPKPTSTQISSPGDIGKGVFQNPHFQSNCLHIHIYIYTYIYISRRWQARPRILLLPHSQHIDIVKLASIVILIYHDFQKFPILGP